MDEMRNDKLACMCVCVDVCTCECTCDNKVVWKIKLLKVMESLGLFMKKKEDLMRKLKLVLKKFIFF